MIIEINSQEIKVEKGTSILSACKFYGINIPTLCHYEGLTDYGACRLCIVEIGEGKEAKIVSSCTYPVSEGLKVRTHSNRVIKSRKMVIELLLARCPDSKILQDFASDLGVHKVRFKVKHDDCILCGLCIRMCKEQMDGHAIDFVDRGKNRRITTPFDEKSETCRLCGGCMFVCPVCQLRCQASSQGGDVCNSCLKFEPVCLKYYDDAQCFMTENCGTCVSVKEGKKRGV